MGLNKQLICSSYSRFILTIHYHRRPVLALTTTPRTHSMPSSHAKTNVQQRLIYKQRPEVELDDIPPSRQAQILATYPTAERIKRAWKDVDTNSSGDIPWEVSVQARCDEPKQPNRPTAPHPSAPNHPPCLHTPSSHRPCLHTPSAQGAVSVLANLSNAHPPKIPFESGQLGYVARERGADLGADEDGVPHEREALLAVHAVETQPEGLEAHVESGVPSEQVGRLRVGFPVPIAEVCTKIPYCEPTKCCMCCGHIELPSPRISTLEDGRNLVWQLC